MLSPKTRRNIFRILPFGLIWLIFSIVYTLLERGLLGRTDHYPNTGNPYSFSRNIVATPLLATVTGLLVGALEILYFSKSFGKKTFRKKIFYKFLIYLFIVCSFIIVTLITSTGNFLAAANSKEFWFDLWIFMTDIAFVSILIYIASIIVVTLFYSEVSETFGHGVLSNFFTGKYNRPVEEERIFMFLDMKSSTTIAEHLGHFTYFEVLKEYFADLSDPVISYAGEVYQYAGDEIIVSWELKRGLRNNNCLRCFFAMKEAINAGKERYMGKFGLVPQFKAGLHYGKVTTGEIGVLRKEIIFTGDVLNTTSRIQSLCNQYNVDILISGDLIALLNRDLVFQTKSLGEALLKGKDERVELFTIIS